MGQSSIPKRGFGRVAVAVVAMTLCVSALTACSTAVADGTQNSDPTPTATIPAPNGGSIDEVVASASPAPSESFAIDEPAELAGGVVLSITDVEKLEVTAETPGEIAGPAVAVTISVKNDGSETIDLSTTMVTATGSKNSYGQATTSTPYSPFMGSVAAGASASAVYVFRLPADERDSLSITVEYVAGAPVALFVGQIN